VSVKKRKISATTLSVVIGLGGVLVLALGVFLLVLPQRGKASELAKEIDATQAEIVQARALAEQKPAQPIRVADLFKLVKAMPDTSDMPGILLQLNQTAHDAGIEFDAITPHDGVPGTGYQAVPIDLEFNGNFYDLNDFLYRLRNLVSVRGGKLGATGRLFSVSSIEFNEGPNGFPNIAAKLTVTAYVYGGAPVATGGAPAPTAPAGTETTPATEPADPATLAAG
jgi:hypothetical protein